MATTTKTPKKRTATEPTHRSPTTVHLCRRCCEQVRLNALSTKELRAELRKWTDYVCRHGEEMTYGTVEEVEQIGDALDARYTPRKGGKVYDLSRCICSDTPVTRAGVLSEIWVKRQCPDDVSKKDRKEIDRECKMLARIINDPDMGWER